MNTNHFTLQDIQAAHSKVRLGADFPKYIQDLIAMGVRGYETYVADGHTEYSGAEGYGVSSPAKYAVLTVADVADAETFKRELKVHQQGGSDYPTFCRMSADTGVGKWVVRMDAMTCTYYDKAGHMLLEEQIPG